jgi:hypothetical protein
MFGLVDRLVICRQCCWLIGTVLKVLLPKHAQQVVHFN